MSCGTEQLRVCLHGGFRISRLQFLERFRNEKWQVLLPGLKHTQTDHTSQMKMLTLISSKTARLAWKCCTKDRGKPRLSKELAIPEHGRGVHTKREHQNEVFFPPQHLTFNSYLAEICIFFLRGMCYAFVGQLRVPVCLPVSAGLSCSLIREPQPDSPC